MRKVLLLAALLVPSFVMAADRHEWIRAGKVAWVEIGEPQAPGAVATITFQNENTHNGYAEFSVTHDGLKVEIEMEWNTDRLGSETLTFIPPEGYVVAPPTLTVPEYERGEAHVFAIGLGM